MGTWFSPNDDPVPEAANTVSGTGVRSASKGGEKPFMPSTNWSLSRRRRPPG